ncbi:MAG: transcription termination/antitermination protein NusA [Clostridiales bacterium]|nr:transcription termination/antitermination protein NusA [Clostridium sp.]NLC42946.1 transcription termination/antitermination protein NusA [Clostridiales bacterium]
MSGELIAAIDDICKEKGIDREVLLEAIEAALVSAYKKNFGSAPNVKVTLNREDGLVKVFSQRTVVDEIEDSLMEISLAEAEEISPGIQLDDILDIEVTPADFGRIAAQNAKQVVVQRIREAERGLIFDKYIERENEVATGLVQRVEPRNVFIDLDKSEAILPPGEQMPGERYQVNDRLKVYITEVKKTNKGPQITVSRTHPGLVKRLFEFEVPEIIRGEVVIKNISREAGSRTKISVFSEEREIDPVGSCVGHRGTRVQRIVEELRGEKIDIIKWSEDPVDYISSALSPARVLTVLPNVNDKSAVVIVPDNQLSLAIGKEGQNARLAAKLTGWKIDIKNQSQAQLMHSNDEIDIDIEKNDGDIF